MTVDGLGDVFVAYRNNRHHVRDIYLSASHDDGQTWSDPVRAGFGRWKVFSCPADAPAIVTDEDGRVHLAWMDAR